ncbi:MAG: nucleoside deaminase [Pseudomonadota bacterium]
MRSVDYYFEHIIGRARERGNPFVAILVDRYSGEILSEGRDRHPENPILHSETDAIHHVVGLRTRGKDISLSDAVMFTTAEPCPMCQAAIIWSGIPEVYYGATRPYLVSLGINAFTMRAETLLADARNYYEGKLIPSHTDECHALFDDLVQR